MMTTTMTPVVGNDDDDLPPPSQQTIYLQINHREYRTFILPDIYNTTEVKLALMMAVRPITPTYTRFISVDTATNRYHLFNILLLLETSTTYSDTTVDSFLAFRKEIIVHFADALSDLDILLLWLLDKVTGVQRGIVRTIDQELDGRLLRSFPDLLDTFPERTQKLASEIREDSLVFEKETKDDVLVPLRTEYEKICGSRGTFPLIQPLVFSKRTVAYHFDPRHSLAYYLDHVHLQSGGWDVAVYASWARFDDWRRLHLTSLREMFLESSGRRVPENVAGISEDDDDDNNTLTLFNTRSSERIYIHADTHTIEADILPFEDTIVLQRIVDKVFASIPELTQNALLYQTRYLSGEFRLRSTMTLVKPIVLDILMNDAFLNRYFVVHELEKANKYNSTTIGCTLDTTIHVQFRFESSSEFTVRFSRCRDDKEIRRLVCMCRVMLSKISSGWEPYLDLYRTLLPPSFLESLVASMMPSSSSLGLPITATTFEKDFALKYKDLLKKTGFKTACRPKTRIPTLVPREEGVRKLQENPLKVLQYPKPGSDHQHDLDIERQYFVCTDPDYSFPGISDLGKGSMYVPCCFNKNPRSSKAFLTYYSSDTIDKSAAALFSTMTSGDYHHIKSDGQIIRKTGDLGRVYPSIEELCANFFPTLMPFRVGVPDTPRSVIHAMSFLLGIPEPEMSVRFSDACNKYPHLIDHHHHDGVDDDAYINPRKYLRIFHLITACNVVVFCKDRPKDATVDLVSPCFTDHTRFYHFSAKFPCLLVLEHWGSSPDRYTRRRFPVCEPIVLRAPTTPKSSDSVTTIKTIPFTDSQIRLLNLVYASRFRYSNQGVGTLTEDTIGVPVSRVVYQQFDDARRLRGVLVEWHSHNDNNPRNGVLVYAESDTPLPPLSVPQHSVDEIMQQHHSKTKKKRPHLIQTDEELTRFLRDMGHHHNDKKDIEYIQSHGRYYIRFPNHSLTRRNRDTMILLYWSIQTARLPGHTMNKIMTTDVPPILFQPSFLGSVADDSSPPIKNEKIARMLMDYIVHMYNQSSSSSSPTEFCDQQTTVRQAYEYAPFSTLSELWAENPLFFDDQGRLIVPSRAAVQRLQFHLVYSIQNTPPLRNSLMMQQQPFLPNFYTRDSDFHHLVVERHTFQKRVLQQTEESRRLGILYIQSSLRQWSPDWREGFWYFLEEIPPRVPKHRPMLFHQVASLQQAVLLSYIWSKTGEYPVGVDLDTIIMEHSDDNTRVRVHAFQNQRWEVTQGRNEREDAVEEEGVTTTTLLCVYILPQPEGKTIVFLP